MIYFQQFVECFSIFSMHKVRDQQGRFISSSKNPHKANSAGHSQEGKELIQPNYLSPTTSSLSKKRPETSTQESETIQVSCTKISSLEDLISENTTSGSSSFPKAPSEKKTTLRGNGT
jgi:hypothetical protein